MVFTGMQRTIFTNGIIEPVIWRVFMELQKKQADFFTGFC